MKKAIATLLLLIFATLLNAHPAPTTPKEITCKMICHRVWRIRNCCGNDTGRWEFYEGVGEGHGIYKQYLGETLYYGIWEWEGNGHMIAMEHNNWNGAWTEYHYQFHPGKTYWKDQMIECYDTDGTLMIYAPHLLP